MTLFFFLTCSVRQQIFTKIWSTKGWVFKWESTCKGMLLIENSIFHHDMLDFICSCYLLQIFSCIIGALCIIRSITKTLTSNLKSSSCTLNNISNRNRKFVHSQHAKLKNKMLGDPNCPLVATHWHLRQTWHMLWMWAIYDWLLTNT